MNTKIIWQRSRTVMQQFFDILFPVHCAGCQRSGHVLCPSCIAQIHPLPSPICQHCGAPLPPGGKCKNCQYHPLSMSGLRAVSAYQEPLRACIHALKYNGNTRLAEPLGQLLARAYTSYGLHADIILPVPLHLISSSLLPATIFRVFPAEVVSSCRACIRQLPSLSLPFRDIVLQHTGALCEVCL